MTYADKYLKDGVDENTIDDLAVEMVRFFDEEFRKIDSKRFTSVVPSFITKFFAQPIKPTLTEDEKVILRNIPTKYQFIGRNNHSILQTCGRYWKKCWTVLYLSKITKHNDDCYCEEAIDELYNHLFQFIKPRRRI